jgi:transposase
MGTLRKIRKARQHREPVPTKPQADGGTEPIDIDRQELEAILEHAKAALSEEEYTKLHAAMETLVFLTAELEKKRVSVQRLKQLLFGATTETTRKVMDRLLDEAGQEAKSTEDTVQNQEPQTRPKPQGHGRNGAGAYSGAEKVHVPHQSLKPGDPCPSCHQGTVYESVQPGRVVRLRGQTPLGATV